MSLFRHASAWTLRALALWGAIELGAGLYDRAADSSAALTQLSGHHAAMIRLDETARARETDAVALEQQSAASLPAAAIPGASPDAVAASMRESLIALGAQAVIVEANAEAPSATSQRLSLAAHWREPRESAPQALYALQQRFPGLGVSELKLETHDALVHIEVDFLARFAPQPEAAP